MLGAASPLKVKGRDREDIWQANRTNDVPSDVMREEKEEKERENETKINHSVLFHVLIESSLAKCPL